MATGCHLRAATSHLRAKTGVLPLRAHLELCSKQFYSSALKPMQPSYLIVTSPPNPPSPQSHPQALFHCILRDQRVRGDDPNIPPVIFGGVLEEGTYPLARRFLRGQMIREIVWESSGPAVPQPVVPAKQLVPQSYRCALSELRSGYCSRLMSYSHSIRWADNPTCPYCHATHYTVTHFFSYPANPTDLAAGGMWTAPLQVAQLMEGLP